MLSTWIAAFTLGLLGSLHCIGMCGPIALALPVGNSSWWRKSLAVLVYNLGRVSTYFVLGTFFGIVGKGIVIAGFQQILSIVVGLSILMFLFLPAAITQRMEAFMFRIPGLNQVRQAITALFKQRDFSAFLMIGALNGLLPCGLVYTGIAGALATADPLDSGIFMAIFGAGTIPAMFTAAMSKSLFSLNLRNKARKLVPVLVGIMAFGLVLRGMNLGIPYLSPQFDKKDCTKHACCAKKK